MAELPDSGNVSARQGSAEQATRGAPASATQPVGARFLSPVRLEVVDSTNRYLADLARAGAPEGTSVLAERQSAGRGRLGRRWVDPGGGSVLCSVLFRPELPVRMWNLFSLLVALAARDACADAAGVDLFCKWPNDLVSADRKVAGVLAEVVEVHGATTGPDGPGVAGAALVVGVGINCNWPSDWLPSEELGADALALRATSLDRLAGRSVDRDAVADRLLDRVGQRLSALGGSLPATRPLLAEYRRNLSTIGRLVRVELSEGTFDGIARDVDDEGHLLVEVGACIRTVAAGDVLHLR
ncbi:MAG: biotin--[acetyl-CoA-carboxylase] ligase [Acidimicrobiales bacterium]